MMKTMYHTLPVMLLVAASACNIIAPEHDPITYGETYIANQLSIDKACYKPGDAVQFTINSLPAGDVKVRYQHLGIVCRLVVRTHLLTQSHL